MIRKTERADLPECVKVIRNSFQTVADEFGFTEENAPRFTAFATTEDRLAWQMYVEHRLMYVDEEDGRICGYYSLRLNGDGSFTYYAEEGFTGTDRFALKLNFGYAVTQEIVITVTVE